MINPWATNLNFYWLKFFPELMIYCIIQGLIQMNELKDPGVKHVVLIEIVSLTILNYANCNKKDNCKSFLGYR